MRTEEHSARLNLEQYCAGKSMQPRHFLTPALTLLLAVLISSMASRGQAHAQADLILTNARVYTVDAEQPWAEALAIAGERIMLVGTAAEVAATGGPETRVVDLHGAFVSAGFNDAHVHMDATGSLITGFNLLKARVLLTIVGGNIVYEAPNP